ncbi:hypothetical protein [Microbulbifer sp. MCCC 1A16149]|uniref:hypothetical protein n=1 Tax=Microbulbifer sp. MCCC 1A16149 TaxID=3411322 RepID=UPI003D14967D
MHILRRSLRSHFCAKRAQGKLPLLAALGKGIHRGIMRIKISKDQWKLILFWSILILIAPFAIETVMLAELAGAEFAIGFLLLYLKQSIMFAREKIAQIQLSIESMASMLSRHTAFRERHFLSHAGLSLVVIATGTPVFYAAIVWYPVLLTGTYT